MLRVLDAHPDYIWEFFEIARRHPDSMQRLLRVTAAHLHEEDLARMTAVELTRAPAGLKTTLVASLDEMQTQPAAMNATAAAIETRPEETAHMLVHRKLAVMRVMRELIQIVSHDTQAAEAFRASLVENATPLADIIIGDPELRGVMLKSITTSGLELGADEIKSIVK